MNYDDDKTREEEEKKERELAALIALGVLLYSDQETEILNIIAAHLSADDFDGDLNKWRSAHLAQAPIVDKEVRGVIGSYSQAEREVFNAVTDQSAVNAVRRVDVPLQSAGIPAAAGASGTASKAAKYFRDQAKHDINTCNTVMRYMSKKGYTAAVNSAFYTAKQSERIWKALGKGALSVAEGRESLQAAVRSTIMNMSRDGIPAFIDKAGRQWSPEAYVRMDLRTTAANTARQATFERCAENDINLIEVDAHSGARPLCAPWQGRIYSLDGTSGTVKDGSGREFNYIPLTSTSYGQAAGLFGINCGHRPYPFRPGVNFKTWQPLSSDEDFDRNSKRYKQFQKQRAMERRIRADKRDCMMCNAAGDKQGFTEASQRLKRSREKYAAYCKNTGLKQHNDRTQVYGFDRSVSAKAVWADRKASGKGIFEDIINSLTKYDYSDILKAEAPRPIDEPDILKQFRYVGKDAYTQEEKLKIANPNRLFNPACTENCQRTIICGELLDRGYDVEALPYLADDVIGADGLACWKGTTNHWYMNQDLVLSSKENFENDIESTMAKWGEGSRAQIHIEWKKNRDNHYITAKYVNGIVEFYDYQNGVKIDISDNIKQWDSDPINGPWFMRIDNREFNENVLAAVKSRGAKK